MRTENRPPVVPGRTAGEKLERSVILRQPRPSFNPFFGELARFSAEPRKCREAFSSDDLAAIKLASIGAQLLCDDMLAVCEQDCPDLFAPSYHCLRAGSTS
jgi:hypothetical protein